MSQRWSVIIIYCHNEACLSVYRLIWALGSSDQVKADRHSKKLSVLQHASRNVNEMAANVVASTRTGQENLEEKGEYRLTCVCTLRSVSSITLKHVYLTDTMDFSGLSLIKLRREEMESQVSRGDGFNCKNFYFFYSNDLNHQVRE